MATTKFSTIIGSAQVTPTFLELGQLALTVSNNGSKVFTHINKGTQFAGYLFLKGGSSGNTTASGASASNFTINLPAGYTIDLTRLPNTSTYGDTRNNLGEVQVFGLPTASQYGSGTTAFPASSTSFSIVKPAAVANAYQQTDLNVAQNVEFSYELRIPIVEFALTAFTAQGAGLATSVKPGIVYRSPQTALTVSGTGWTTIRAVGIAYMDNNGVWRMTFNIFGSVASTARTIFGITVTGIVTKNVATLLQGIGTVANTVGTVPPSTGYIGANSNAMTCEHASATTVSYSFFGDIELESKPSWA